MDKLYKTAILLLDASIALLVYFGLPDPWGSIAAVLVLLTPLIAFFLNRRVQKKYPEIRRSFRIPVLCFFFLVVVGMSMSLLDKKPPMLYIYVLFVLGGLCGVAGWIAGKGYKKPFNQLWKEGLYIFPWEVDLVLALVFLFGCFKKGGMFSWVSILIIGLAILDIANQWLMKCHRTAAG